MVWAVAPQRSPRDEADRYYGLLAHPPFLREREVVRAAAAPVLSEVFRLALALASSVQARLALLVAVTRPCWALWREGELVAVCGTSLVHGVGVGMPARRMETKTTKTTMKRRKRQGESLWEDLVQLVLSGVMMAAPALSGLPVPPRLCQEVEPD